MRHTFSMVSDNNGKPDAGDIFYSRWIRQILKLEDHHEIYYQKDLLRDIPVYVGELDQPIGDSAFILTSLLSKKASDHVGILVTGAGADEYFAGYNRHAAFNFYLKYHFLIKKGFLS